MMPARASVIGLQTSAHYDAGLPTGVASRTLIRSFTAAGVMRSALSPMAGFFSRRITRARNAARATVPRSGPVECPSVLSPRLSVSRWPCPAEGSHREINYEID